jgi:hypothetical protein
MFVALRFGFAFSCSDSMIETQVLYIDCEVGGSQGSSELSSQMLSKDSILEEKHGGQVPGGVGIETAHSVNS